MERHFTVGVAHLRAEMAAMHLRQFEARHVPEPEKKGQRRLLDIFRQLLADFEEGFLEHVRIIDAPLETAAQAQAHHPLQTIPMARKQILKRLLVPSGGALQQLR
jgi:hypothetical protein